MRAPLPLLLTLSLLLAGCGQSVPLPAVSGPDISQAVSLPDGQWPDHALTADLPQPEGGTVADARATEDGKLCCFTLTGLTEEALTAWLNALSLADFATLSFTQEKDTTCALLTGGSVCLSIAHNGESAAVSVVPAE